MGNYSIRKKRFEVVFLQESVLNFSPEPSPNFDKKDLNKKNGKYRLKNRIKRWKDALKRKQKFILNEQDPDIKRLWSEYIDYAE